MSEDDLEGLRVLRERMQAALHVESGAWVREQMMGCIGTIDALLASGSPPIIAVQRARARAKSLLAVGKSGGGQG